MPIREHPARGSIVVVDYSLGGFTAPEMVKRRLAVVLTPKISSRPKLCTIVPLSLSTPPKIMPYHAEIDIPFELPKSWGNKARWVKGDMVNAVGFHRVDLLRLGKDQYGQRIYQYQALPTNLMKVVQRCVLHGMGLSPLTKHI